jgi:hypothetical protein
MCAMCVLRARACVPPGIKYLRVGARANYRKFSCRPGRRFVMTQRPGKERYRKSRFTEILESAQDPD